jgi:quercetin dioxygenase-like cupin family protein
MNVIRLDNLPFAGMSHAFVGDDHGAPISAYLVAAKPGEGPPLHVHPYVEVIFVIEGEAKVTLGDSHQVAKTGDVVVIPAHTQHKFLNTGATVLKQVDVHASGHFIQKDLE